MTCPMTGRPHRTFWMRSALWCHDCRQKVETCCEGNVSDLLTEDPQLRMVPSGATSRIGDET